MTSIHLRAFQARLAIERALRERPPAERPGRVEDIVAEALIEHESDARYECRRNFVPEEERPSPGWLSRLHRTQR